MKDAGLQRFHHVGVAVRDIDAAREMYGRVFGAVAESPVFHDTHQRVMIQFVRMGDLRVELLAPGGESSPVESVLKRGLAIYHVCHEVRDIEGELARLREAGCVVVSPPKPAVAFDQRRVAFVMCQGLMVELLESERNE